MGSAFTATATNQSAGDGKKAELLEAGAHGAVLAALIDLGTHEDEYMGQKSDRRKILFVWEVCNGEYQSDGGSFIVAQDYAIFGKLGSKSKLRSLLESWRGKPFADGEGFDLTEYLGKPCLLNVAHATSSKGNAYAKLMGVSPLPKGMQLSKPFHAPMSWSIEDDLLDAIPDYVPFLYGKDVREVIKSAKDFVPFNM